MKKIKEKNERVPKKKALSELKEEILAQARLLAEGKISTAYPLVTATKEMMALEKLEEDTSEDF